MKEKEGYRYQAKRNGVEAEFFTEELVDDDILLRACVYCNLGSRGFIFSHQRIRVPDPSAFEDPPFKGTGTNVWIIKGSVRDNRD